MTEVYSNPRDASANPAIEPWVDEKQYWFVVLLLVIGSACLVRAIYYLWIGLTGPALDLFAFRQTQTAISAYWAWHDGFRLAYETPALGFPWSIPFEFPIYQWLMALARYAGIPFDVGGRLVSFGFYIATLLPLWSLTRSLKLDTATFLIIAVLFLCCPLYVFYSRTIMIESCALFFGMAWLAALARFLGRPNYGALAGTIALGSLAVLAKSTTFPAFVVLGGFLMLSALFALWRGIPSAPRFGTLLLAGVACLVPLAIGYGWVIYSDAVKTHNVLGAMLTSKSLGLWNFGTLTQRLSSKLWNDVIFTRALSDIFGNCSLIALIAAGALLTSRRHLLFGLATAAAFLVPFLVFTNLHIIHSYYQYANAIFALATVGLAIGHIARTGHRALAGLILITISLGQVFYFRSAYATIFALDLKLSDVNRIAQLAKANTTPEDGLVVLGQDWSSAVPYYSERKALVIPGWAPLPVFQQMLAKPEMFLGDLHLGAVVYCPEGDGYGDRKPLVDAFVAQRVVIAEAGTCKLLSPKAQP
jgi:hypothetical protein